MKTEVAPPPPGPGQPEPEVDRRRSHRITLVVLALSGIVGALWVLGPVFYAGHDDPTAIDSKPVRKAVLAGCTQLRADLDAVPKSAAGADRAETENRAVERFLSGVRALGPDALTHDQPVERWLADWEHIVAARREAVAGGKRFSTPIVDGAPLNIRMFELIRSGLGKCDVPPQLLDPEPGRI